MMARTADSGTARSFGPLFAASGSDDLSSHAQRQFIGSLGLVLPVLLWIIAGWRHSEGLPRWEALGSISAYYHTGAVAAFVGILVALGIFLFTYRGYNNEFRRRDRVAAIVAGGAAVLVAFFPAEAPNDLPAPPWWTPLTGTIHYASAVILFCSFSFFSLFLFPKSRVEGGKPIPADKQARNGIYILCGIGMAGCMLWAGSAYFTEAPIFLPESLALEFFAVSWLVKGRADRTAVAVGRRTVFYGLHPKELISELWSAVRGEAAKDRNDP